MIKHLLINAIWYCQTKLMLVIRDHFRPKIFSNFLYKLKYYLNGIKKKDRVWFKIQQQSLFNLINDRA